MPRRALWLVLLWSACAAALTTVHVLDLDRLVRVYPGPHQGYVPLMHWGIVCGFAFAVAKVLGLRVRDALGASIGLGIASDLVLSLAATVREARRPDYFDNRIFFLYLELASAALFAVAGCVAGWLGVQAARGLRRPVRHARAAVWAPYVLVSTAALAELLAARAWLPLWAALVAAGAGIVLAGRTTTARGLARSAASLGRRTWGLMPLPMAITIFVLVVAFNANVGAQVGDRFPLASDDGDAYHALGLAMATGHLEFRDLRSVEESWWYRSPGYPLFVSAVYRVFPGSFLAIGVAQAAVAAASVWLLWLLGSRLFDRATASVAAALMATSGLLVQTFAALFSEAIYVPVSIAIVLVLCAARTTVAARLRLALLALAGAVVGYGILVKPQLEVFLPVAVGWWLVVRGLPVRRAAIEALVIVLAAATVIAPVVIRDVEANGRLTVLDQRHASETWKISELGLRLIPLGVDGPAADRLLGAFVSRPAEVAGAVAEAIPSAVSQVFLGPSFGKADPLQLHRASPWAHALNVYVVVFAVVGLIASWRRPGDLPGRVLLLGYVLANAVVFLVVAQALVRYRIPLDPLLFLWVAAGAAWLFEVARHGMRSLGTLRARP